MDDIENGSSIAVTPPIELQQRVFPFLQAYQGETGEKKLQEGDGTKFKEVLENLSIVLLQDVAFLSTLPSWEKHALFEHELFRSPEFLDFKNTLLDVVSQTGDKSSFVAVKNLIPSLAEGLQAVQDHCTAGQARAMAVVKSVAAGIVAELKMAAAKNDARWESIHAHLARYLQGIGVSSCSTCAGSVSRAIENGLPGASGR